ncbi:MAG: Rrf2 family transcriptional regulator [Candidatus Kapabacteria bacterium]|nr:Rrf2 family transcriptional regulator [Candidatus Kapabacteria bacterium]
MLSKSSTYAIQALAFLAAKGSEPEFTPISEIAETLSIPYHFLKKILAELSQKGLLHSQRSARGGVGLNRDAKSITLLDIITALDGSSLFSECILGLPGCGEKTPCALHNAWAAERSRLHLMFSSTTLSDIAKRIHSKGFRIS